MGKWTVAWRDDKNRLKKVTHSTSLMVTLSLPKGDPTLRPFDKTQGRSEFIEERRGSGQALVGYYSRRPTLVLLSCPKTSLARLASTALRQAK